MVLRLLAILSWSMEIKKTGRYANILVGIEVVVGVSSNFGRKLDLDDPLTDFIHLVNR